MAIIDELLRVPEREDGGRTAYDRFDFQTAWGVSQVLKLHTAGANYAVAFEFHDDIVELDDADQPSLATFYQLKTLKTGTWTIKKIVKRTTDANKKPKPSFAGKMFENFLRFKDAVKKLVFVSNQPLSDLTDGAEEEPFLSASQTAVSTFTTAMSLECPTFSKDDHLALFHFNHCHLSLGSYDMALIGEVTMFLKAHTSAEASAHAFTLSLVDEGRRRSKALSDVASFEELKKSKFMTKQNLDQWLHDLETAHAHRPAWDTVSRQLAAPHPEDAKIERAWHSYLSERKRRWNAATLELSRNVKALVEPIIDSADSLAAGLEESVPVVRERVRTWRPGATDHFVKAVILYEYKR